MLWAFFALRCAPSLGQLWSAHKTVVLRVVVSSGDVDDDDDNNDDVAQKTTKVSGFVCFTSTPPYVLDAIATCRPYRLGPQSVHTNIRPLEHRPSSSCRTRGYFWPCWMVNANLSDKHKLGSR